MLAVIGTVPEQDFPLVEGNVRFENSHISIDGRKVSVNRGTPALLAAAIKITELLGTQTPFAYLVGDIGRGDGSKKLYKYLKENIRDNAFSTVALHYIQPLVEWHFHILNEIESIEPKPVIIADAGAMYMAKMSGQSDAYDLFTPDIGELAFLADEVAPHPFYTRGFILHEEDKVLDLIAKAYFNNDAPKYLLVKGSRDYIVDREGVIGLVDSPAEESMEAIGGTGDTLTGIVAALCASGMKISEAAILAARINRVAGSYARPTPATQVFEIIRHIPEAFKTCIEENSHG